MNNLISGSSLKKNGIVLLSGSAGELDWVLPILDNLLKRGFCIKIIFLTRHSHLSVKRNRMLNDYISQQNSNIEFFLCGGYFFEKLEHFSYLAHRTSIKLNFDKKPIVRSIYNFLSNILKNFFLLCIPSFVLELRSEKCLFFSEYPSLRRPRDSWLRSEFTQALFFYCPHSPHVYAEDLDTKHPIPQFKNLNSRFFLLLGHPSDFEMINDNKELDSPELEKVFIGHPKYSDSWLYELKRKSEAFRASISKRNKVNILILSRGSGSYLDDNSHANLIEMSVGAIRETLTEHNLFVKKHPREINSHWDKVSQKYSSITIIEDHILSIATSVDFVISFWSSGAMDCYALGVPVIEFFNPNKHSKQQVFNGSEYTTIYRLLGLVLSANNLNELVNAILTLKRDNFSLSSIHPHSHHSELIRMSNEWNKKIDMILAHHKLINN